MAKKGIDNQIFTGTVRTFFSKKVAEEFVDQAAERGYRCELREVPQAAEEGSRWRVTVLPKALPDQETFRGEA